MIFMSVSGFAFKLAAKSRNALLEAALTVLELVANKIPESNVTFSASPLLMVSTVVSSGNVASNSFFCLSIFLPIRAPAVPPTAAPIIEPNAVLPAKAPTPAPTAAPPPTPIAVPLAVLFHVPQLVKTTAIQSSKTDNNLKFLIFLFFYKLYCNYTTVY